MINFQLFYLRKGSINSNIVRDHTAPEFQYINYTIINKIEKIPKSN